MKVIYNPLTNAFEPSDTDILLPQIMWHITDQCHLNCKTCFVKERKLNSPRRSCEQMLEKLSILKRLGVQKIDLSGGEPLLFDNLPKLVDQAKQQGFYLTLTTRGVGKSENCEWVLNNWRKFSRIIVSIDGCNEEISDFYSGYRGSFSQAMNMCLQLKKCDCDRLRINTVVNKCILGNQEKNDLVHLVNGIKPREWCLIEPHPANKTDSFDQYSVTPEEYVLFLQYITHHFVCGQTQLLSRRKTMYGTYWALYPDNTICRLSDDEVASFSVDFTEQNYPKIVAALSDVKHLLP